MLGHEGAGVVRRVGSAVKDKTLKEGDLVFLSFTTCNSCSHCQDGRKGFCRAFTEINFGGVRGMSAAASPISFPDGKPIRGQFFGQSSMSKLAIVSEASVVKSPVGITEADLAPLAPLGCGYLTGAGTVLNVLQPKPSSRFAVLGMGAVGLAAAMAARALGVETVVAVDIVDAKLELATSLGATHTLNTKRVSDLAQGLHEMFPDGVDYILDTTGVVPLLQSSVKALGHGGTLVIVGVASAGVSLNIEPLEFMVNCKRIIGAIEGSADPAKVSKCPHSSSRGVDTDPCDLQLLPQLLDWYKNGKFPIDTLATVYDVDSLGQALEDLRNGKIIKPVIKWMDL